MTDLVSYIKQFAQLRRAPGAVWTVATKKQAPHKPILLLAVLDMQLLGSDQANVLYLRIEHDEIFAIPSLGSVFLRAKKGR